MLQHPIYEEQKCIDIHKSKVFPDSYAQLPFTQNGANSLITSSNLDPIFQPPLETPGIQKKTLQLDVSYNSAEEVGSSTLLWNNQTISQKQWHISSQS